MKRIRLPLDAYTGAHVWHLTLHAATGIAPFGDEDLVGRCLNSLQVSSKKYNVRIYAYCFMPNHIHLLVHNYEGDDLLRFVRHFKQVTGFRYKQEASRELWQVRFYDRALRSDDDVREAAEYIIGNPVAAGLAPSSGEFPFSGSLEWSIFDD